MEYRQAVRYLRRRNAWRLTCIKRPATSAGVGAQTSVWVVRMPAQAHIAPMDRSHTRSRSASPQQVVRWHHAPQQPSQTPPARVLTSPRLGAPAPSRLSRSLGALGRPLQWVKARLRQESTWDLQYKLVLGSHRTVISGYLGYAQAGDLAGWYHAALTGRPDSSLAPQVPVGEPRIPTNLVFPGVSDPAGRADLGRQVFMQKDGKGPLVSGRSLGWGQDPPRPMSWTVPVGGAGAYRPVELAVVVRETHAPDVRPDTKHSHAWDDGITVEYRLGGWGADTSVWPSQGVGGKLKPVRLREHQLLEGVAAHRSVLVRLTPASAPTMVVLQARNAGGDWIARRPTSDSERERTGQMWTMLVLPADMPMTANPYDNMDRAEHPRTWRGARTDDVLHVEGYAVMCVRTRRSDPLATRDDLMDIFCPDSQGSDAHRRLALRDRPGDQPADWLSDAGKPVASPSPGKFYTIAIPPDKGAPFGPTPTTPTTPTTRVVRPLHVALPPGAELISRYTTTEHGGTVVCTSGVLLPALAPYLNKRESQAGAFVYRIPQSLVASD